MLLEIAPHPVCPSISASDPSRGPRVDPAVERFVALPQLLPFEPAEAALGLNGDQLLADELLHPFGFGAARQVHVACWVADTSGNLLVGRR